MHIVMVKFKSHIRVVGFKAVLLWIRMEFLYSFSRRLCKVKCIPTSSMFTHKMYLECAVITCQCVRRKWKTLIYSFHGESIYLETCRTALTQTKCTPMSVTLFVPRLSKRLAHVCLHGQKRFYDDISYENTTQPAWIIDKDILQRCTCSKYFTKIGTIKCVWILKLERYGFALL